ncbi:hypothetical protein CCP4SC76_7870005 [Gammaproteobacteria bacterium]
MVVMVASPQDSAAARRLTPPPPRVAAADWWRRLYQVNTQPMTMIDESWWAGLPAPLKTRFIERPRGRRLMSQRLLKCQAGLGDPCWNFDLPLRRLLLLPPQVFQDLLRWAGAAAQAERLRALVQRQERNLWIAALGSDTFECVVRLAPLRLGSHLTRLERVLTLPDDPLERTVRLGVACLGEAWVDDPVLAPRARWYCPRHWAPWFGQPCLFPAPEALSLSRKLLSESHPLWLPWLE